jgi:hypothetical protein
MPIEHEPWIERTLREAVAAGHFDEIEGRGRPIADLDEPYDANWWARRWWERNRALEEAGALAADVQRRLPFIMARAGEEAVRAGLEELNEEIEAAAVGAHVDALDVESMLADWRTRRSRRRGPAT